MKSLTKKLLSIFMVLCLTLLSFGFVKVNAVAIERKTVAEFLALPESATYYELEGKITNIKNTTFGNFDFEDATGTIFCYGLTATKLSTNDKSFASLNLKVGDEIVIAGQRSSYNKNPQIKGAYFVGHKQFNSLAEKFETLETSSSLNASYIANKIQLETVIPTGYTQDYLTNKTLNVKNELVDINFSKGGNNSNSPALHAKDGVRMYTENEMTIITSFPVASIEFTCDASKNLTKAKTNVGTISGNTITFSTDDVQHIVISVIKGSSKSTRLYFKNIKINFLNAGSNATKTVYEISKSLSAENVSQNEVALRFGTMLEKTFYDGLNLEGTNVKFGVVYAKASELGTKTFTDAVVDKTVHVEECTPELVGTDYQFAIVLNHIPATAFDDAVTAACYVEIDGVMHLMNAKTYSVNSIALEYVNNHAKDANVVDHLGMLKWLSTYKETITK